MGYFLRKNMKENTLFERIDRQISMFLVSVVFVGLNYFAY